MCPQSCKTCNAQSEEPGGDNFPDGKLYITHCPALLNGIDCTTWAAIKIYSLSPWTWEQRSEKLVMVFSRTSQRKYKVSNHQADRSVYFMAWCLIWWFANIEYTLILHDTKYPSWDLVLLSNTKTNSNIYVYNNTIGLKMWLKSWYKGLTNRDVYR